MNSIALVDSLNSNEEFGSKISKRNFSLLNLKGKTFKIIEQGQIIFEEGQLYIHINEFRNALEIMQFWMDINVREIKLNLRESLPTIQVKNVIKDFIHLLHLAIRSL